MEIKRSLGIAVATACVGLTLGSAVATASPATDRGALLAQVPVTNLDQEQLAKRLVELEFGSPAPKFGVDAYRVTYRTITPRGAPTTATGLVVVPRNRDRSLQLVSYQHGTLALKRGAASVDDGKDRGFSLAFGGAGYAVAAPDYLGLGEGPGQHPYMHAESETTASVDLLRATRTFINRTGRHVERDVLATGFSQGGTAAMALGKALNRGADRYFQLGALAPISGPHDLVGAELPATLNGGVEPHAANYYLSYFTISMNRLYRIYDSPSEVFKAPYDKTVEGLFDGSHHDGEIIQGLPHTVQNLLTPEFLAKLRKPSGALLRALEQSDGNCDWRPRVPVKLFAARADSEVVIANSESCQRDLRSNGVRAPLTDLGNLGHRDTPGAALPDVLRLFQQAGR